MSVRRVLFAAAMTALTACASVKTHETGFLDRTVSVAGTSSRFVVYVPRDLPASPPVILFLHGAGERGSDAHRATQVGLGSAIRWSAERFPAIVIFPQAPENDRWLGVPADVALAALEQTMVEFDADRDRVYLTGISMGGYGTWHLATAAPSLFAALAPVCGGILPAGSATSVRQSPLTKGAADPYAFTAERVRAIPSWIFHGADDTVVLPSESRKMHEALRAESADVRYTEYEGVGHNAWDRAYGEPALWEWLFTQRRTD